MTRVRRGGYVFVTWKGDHMPRHVHVFRSGKLIAKWNLEWDVAMCGHVSRRVRALIDALNREGSL